MGKGVLPAFSRNPEKKTNENKEILQVVEKILELVISLTITCTLGYFMQY